LDRFSYKELNKVVLLLKECIDSLEDRDNSEILEVRGLNSDNLLVEYCDGNSFL